MQRAMLLIGPTGSGKTPLGQALETRGLGALNCLHFDFGSQLRHAVNGNAKAGMSEQDLAVVRNVLETRALLEDSDFPIALRLLRGFLASHDARKDDWIVLNGLPRHEGQARGLQGLLKVDLVVHLVCEDRMVLSRIGTNAGGDRNGRTDDSLEDVREKLEIFRNRTKPLIDYYEGTGARIITLAVEANSGGEEARSQLLEEMGFADR
jgi:adenylate kinase